jgi:hypothetical protein
MGGNFPVYTGEISLSDTGALYENLNQYSPLPVNAFLSPQALELGVFSRAQTPTLTLLGGFTYNRPARFDGIPNEPFFLASYFNILGRAILETKNAFHRFDFKSTIFKDEENAARIAAHHEGLLWQVRYGYLHSRQKVSWQGGLGFAIKMPDANRKFKLKSKLQSVDDNDNLQRVFGEYALSWVPRVNYAWRFHLVPKALFAVDGLEFGSETELGAGVGFKIWEVHRIRGGATFLYGNYAGKQYMGIGVKGEFAFRHLGFQDLEGESIDGGREP